MVISGVYQIRNLVNGKRYVGSSINLKKREKEHIGNLKKNRHINFHLQNSWNKYGENNFIFEILEKCQSEKLLEKEQFYINLFFPEYNICKTAGNTIGYKHTKTSLNKFSGENHYGSKLTQKQVDEIRKKYDLGESQKKLVNEYRVSRGCIQGIIKNKTWHDEEYILNKERIPSTQKLTKSLVLKIRNLYLTEKYTQKELGKMFNVARGTIRGVISNERWNDKNYNHKKKNRTKSVLGEEQVMEIRDKYSTGDYSLKSLKKEYNVSYSIVFNIVFNHTWKHLPLCQVTRKTKQKQIENHPESKISFKIAQDIREKYNSGNFFQKELAKEYNLSRMQILRIVKNRAWKKLD
jgi:group I intron endonuclease